MGSRVKNRQTKLTADAADVQIRRNNLLYADIDRFVRAQKVVQGAAKESRELIVSRDQTPPEVAGTGIPVWVRDEWSASEKSMVDSARSAGPDSPIVYVFIPRLSAEDLRRWIIDAAAAEQTIESKGVPATPEGAEAKRSVESRLALAIKNRDTLVREIVGSAKVFQGGGSEMLQLTLDAKLRDVVTSSLACSRDLAKRIRPPGRSRCRRPGTGPTNHSAQSAIQVQQSNIRFVRKCSRASAWGRREPRSGRSSKPPPSAGVSSWIRQSLDRNDQGRNLLPWQAVSRIILGEGSRAWVFRDVARRRLDLSQPQRAASPPRVLDSWRGSSHVTRRPNRCQHARLFSGWLKYDHHRPELIRIG